MHSTAKLLLALALAGASHAAPIQWTIASGGNGHWYEYVPSVSIFDTVLFSVAQSTAASSTHLGQPGYLVTVTSLAEQNFIVNSVILGSGRTVCFFGGGCPTSIWIGASDATVEGEYRWISGPEAGTLLSSGFTNWAGSEPSQSTPGHDYAQISFLAISPENATWRAAPDQPLGTGGYVIEYGAAPPASSGAIPEPSTLALSALALGALLYRRR